MLTARQIVDKFGNTLLADVLGVPVGTVSAWKSRGNIPHTYWRKIAAEARKRKYSGVTYGALEGLSKPRRSRNKQVLPNTGISSPTRECPP